MLTETAHSALILAAGPDFAWEGMSSSRPANDSRTPLRAGLFAFLLDYSGGVCAFHGGPLKEAWHVCHVVSAGGARLGWVEGNVAAGCTVCNEVDRQKGPVVAYSSIKRPDLIPTVWPARETLLALGHERKAQALAERMEILADRYGE